MILRSQYIINKRVTGNGAALLQQAIDYEKILNGRKTYKLIMAKECELW